MARAENIAQHINLPDTFVNPESWPVTSDGRYGEVCIKQQFMFDPRRVLQGFWDSKEDSGIIPEDWSPVIITILSLTQPSSAECERGFSLINIIISLLRCSVLMQTVSPLMFVSLNGPPLSKGNPKGYVKYWLVKHRGATDTRPRTCKPVPQVEKGGAVVGKLGRFYTIFSISFSLKALRNVQNSTEIAVCNVTFCTTFSK